MRKSESQELGGRDIHCFLGQCDLKLVMTFGNFAMTEDTSAWGTLRCRYHLEVQVMEYQVELEKKADCRK